MAFINGILSIAALLSYVMSGALGECQSYGVDYVNGGSYFSNTALSDYFNFTSFFEGKMR
jgi:hypothetical protein